jgi:hypothetical protein
MTMKARPIKFRRKVGSEGTLPVANLVLRIDAMTQILASAKRVTGTVALLLLASQGYAVVEPPQLPNFGNAPMTRDRQIHLGFQAASQMYQQMPVLPDTSPERRRPDTLILKHAKAEYAKLQ